jgi:photosystem II stability/assembly factor-like uncharacterized protein
MTTRLMYLGTKDGVVTLQWERRGWEQRYAALSGRDVWVVAGPHDDLATVYAGAYGDGLYESRDAGRSWQAVGSPEDLRYVRTIGFPFLPSGEVYIGTEPANLYVWSRKGDTWRDVGLRQLPGADDWFLPYSPRGGAVRTLVVHPSGTEMIYGGIEQGGVIKSVDGGTSWTISSDGVHPDVHNLAVHPDDPAIVFAATGGGVYRSRDSTATWERLIGDYTRAVAFHPITPEVILAGPARRVGQEGRILASEDGGDTWTLAAQGLEVPMLHMVESFTMHPEFPNDVFAVTSQGQLLRSRADHIRWRPLLDRVPFVHSLAISV